MISNKYLKNIDCVVILREQHRHH